MSLQRYTKALNTLQRASLVEKSRQKPQERMSTLTNVGFIPETFSFYHFGPHKYVMVIFFCFRLLKAANMMLNLCYVLVAFQSVLILLILKAVFCLLQGYVWLITSLHHFDQLYLLVLLFLQFEDEFSCLGYPLWWCLCWLLLHSLTAKSRQWGGFLSPEWAVEF